MDYRDRERRQRVHHDSEKLTGDEFGLDVMNDLDGRNVGVSVKKKLAMRAGETDKAVTMDLPEVREMGRRIGEALGHIGNLDVDIMQRADGAYCVLELNPRFGGGFPFSYEVGVNLPKAIIQWLKTNRSIPPPSSRSMVGCSRRMII